MISYTKWLGVFPLVAALLLIWFNAYSSREMIRQPAGDSSFVRVTHYAGVNVRSAANGHSAVLKVARNGEKLHLLDSASRKWFKVTVNQVVGYVNKRFGEVVHEHFEQVSETERYVSDPYAVIKAAVCLLIFFPLIWWLRQEDRRRLWLDLHYDMDPQFQRMYQDFSAHFAHFAGSARIWQYLNRHQVSDRKRHGGAGQLIKRSTVSRVAAHEMPLPYFSTNVKVPYLRLSHLELYFLPERLLLKRGGSFAAIFYKNLRVSSSTTRFIEDESLPRDAQVVDRTWLYVNKQGGPDRRFRNNRQLPVCNYSQYTLTSDTGIHEVIATSKPGAMDAFAGLLLHIGVLQSGMPIN